MAKPIQVTTSQFKTMLVRRLKNIVPSCELEFVDGLERGIGFRLKDGRGRYRSNMIRIYRYRPDVLDRDKLTRSIRRAGIPEAGFPKDF